VPLEGVRRNCDLVPDWAEGALASPYTEHVASVWLEVVYEVRPCHSGGNNGPPFQGPPLQGRR
jgi:hypothetical protein